MFIPTNFRMTNKAEQHQFVEQNGFGVMLSSDLQATHLPFILNTKEGEQGALYTHCAKANPHWKLLDNKKVLIIFTGPHGYISPSWYERSPGVPTWNYSAVHILGKTTILDAPTTLQVVNKTVEKYEPILLQKRDVLTEDYQNRLAKGIVGLKIDISSIEGKHKLSQNRPLQDQQNIREALLHSADLNDQLLAQHMQDQAKAI